MDRMKRAKAWLMAARGGARRRRGTVLLLVLGALAVISLAAVSYVTVVQLDRRSAEAVSRVLNFQQQIDVVSARLRTLVAADLFGNKIVTTSTPRAYPDRTTRGRFVPIWPTMFEDGEFADYPRLERRTLNTNRVGQQPSTESTLLFPGSNGARAGEGQRYEPALRDDAWLAPVDPLWGSSGTNNTDQRWAHITNLRSAYVYETRQRGQLLDDRWVREDGRYADLAQFFVQSVDIAGLRRGNPAADLLAVAPGVGTSTFDPISQGFGNQSGMPDALNPDASVFVPMPFLDGERVPNPVSADARLQPRDERFWADTDGDGYPDSRWTQLDELGELYGLVWVTAARVIDASALVNYNASLEGGFGTNGANSEYALGETPADIDLYRLLATSGQDQAFASGPRFNFQTDDDKRVETFQVGQAFNDLLTERLNLPSLFEALLEPRGGSEYSENQYTTDLRPEDVEDWRSNNERLTALQRRAYWEEFGSDPERPTVGSDAQAFPLDDLVDLASFWGLNNASLFSSAEAAFDGPEDENLLPTSDDAEPPFGPMRSKALTETVRERPANWSDRGDVFATIDELRFTPRRHLTPVSGVSDVSPVPVLNDADDFVGVGLVRKVRLRDFTTSDVPAAFEQLVFALAPFATDEPLGLASQRPGEQDFLPHAANPAYGGGGPRPLSEPDDSLAHYGGFGASAGEPPGPAGGLPGFENQPPDGGVGASFAIATAAQLAVNLADASDTDSVPTVARLLVPERVNDVEDNEAPFSDCDSVETVILGTRFAQGDVPNQLLDEEVIGRFVQGNGNELSDACNGTSLASPVTPGGAAGALDGASWLRQNARDTGLTIVGLERQPYIIDVQSAVLVEAAGGAQLDIPVEALLAVQLANPWDRAIDLDDFRLLLPSDTDRDSIDPQDTESNLVLEFRDNALVPAGGVRTFVWHQPPLDEAEPGVLAQLESGSESAFEFDEDMAPTFLGLIENVHSEIDPATGPLSDELRQGDVPFFEPYRSDSPTILLLREVAGLTNDNAAADRTEPVFAVVDRLAADDLGEAFPFFETADLTSEAFPTISGDSLDVDGYWWNLGYEVQSGTDAAAAQRVRDKINERDWAGWWIATRSLNRAGAGAGFPGYVVDDPALNGLFAPAPENELVHAWALPVVADGPDGIPGNADDDPEDIVNDDGLPAIDLLRRDRDGLRFAEGFQSVVELTTLAEEYDEKSAAVNDPAPMLHGWQFYVPNAPLRNVSELHMLSTLSHLCINNEVDRLGSWQTAGEQLALARRFNAASAGDTTNPFPATLDPTRFIPSGVNFDIADWAGVVPDEALAMPLALRVFDGFEALDPLTPELAQGRININTAPERVLEVLPLVAPGESGVGPLDRSVERVRKLSVYRDGIDVYSGQVRDRGPVNTQTTAFQSAPGPYQRYRRTDTAFFAEGGADDRPHMGVARVGELAILDTWQNVGQAMMQPVSNADGFVEPALGGGLSAPLAYTESGAGGGFNPVDDAEERLALFRAVSNIATTRSDVFIAWFIVRGYDPDVIANIEVPGTSEDDALDAMDNTDVPFEPAFEQRWLAVLDRSNVRTPVDRPRVLLLAELPSVGR